MSTPHPPRPRVAFRVAIVGHRRDKLPLAADEAVAAAIRTVLTTVEAEVEKHHERCAALYRDETPLLTVLSALAEGADRLGARAARERPGWQLHAVLPYAEHDYESDFGDAVAQEPDSLATFRELLLAADHVTTLDGVPGRFDAYVPLGRTMVEMCDLLIAVWDGAPPAGPGGTANLVARARRDDVPVVRIDPTSSGFGWLEDLSQDDQGRADGLRRLGERLGGLLAPPSDPGPALRWFHERGDHRSIPRLYDRVLGLLGGFGGGWLRRFRPPRPAPVPPDPGAVAEAAWRAGWPELDRRIVDQAAGHFARHAGWADEMARWYAARFRSSFSAVYVLAVAAVLVGGLLHLDPLVGIEPVAVVLAAGEPILLAAMLWRVRTGRRSAFHERWLDYRSLAERARHLGLLWPLGRTTPLVRMPPRTLPDDPRLGWVGWLLRAMAREAGLVPGRLDRAHAEASRRLVARVEASVQREFHHRRRGRLGHLTDPIERLAEGLVIAALALSLLQHTDLAGWLIELVTDAEKSRVIIAEQRIWVVLAAVVTTLPAMAAAVHGFLGTADLEGIALRSASIEGRLVQLEDQLARLDPVDLTSVGDVVAEMTRAMEGELGSWHAAAASRRLQPG